MGNFGRGTLMVLVLLTACSSDKSKPTAADASAPMPLARSEVAGTQWRADRIVVVGGLTKDGRASARAPTSTAR